MEEERLSDYQRKRREIAKEFLLNISLDGRPPATVNKRCSNAALPAIQPVAEVHIPLQNGSTNGHDNSIENNSITNEEHDVVQRQRSFSESQVPENSNSNNNLKQSFNDKEKPRSISGESRGRQSSFSQRKKPLVHQISFCDQTLQSADSIENMNYPGLSRKASQSLSDTSNEGDVKSIRYYKAATSKERIVVMTPQRHNLVLVTIITDGKALARKRHTSSNRQLSIINDAPHEPDLFSLMGLERPEDGQEISYFHLLNPSSNWDPTFLPNVCTSPQSAIPPSMIPYFATGAGDNVVITQYHAHILDNPSLTVGKHSKVLAFTCYISSMIEFIHPQDLKEDLNQKFKMLFPSIDLTLSKLRSLKREMFLIAVKEAGLELYIVAQAYVYFEKIVLKALIRKHNRKACAGACILLSAKLEDVKGAELTNLILTLENNFRFNRQELLACEFGVLVALEFSLITPNSEIMPHYQRLLSEF